MLSDDSEIKYFKSSVIKNLGETVFAFASLYCKPSFLSQKKLINYLSCKSSSFINSFCFSVKNTPFYRNNGSLVQSNKLPFPSDGIPKY